MPQAQVEHRAILEACKAGDADLAASLMYDHVVTVGNAIIEYVRRQEEPEDSLG
jgi:DNA-binding GntR family transcriptional regulator